MISHRNVMANVLQLQAYEKNYRLANKKRGDKYEGTEIALGLLPQSHIYALVVICHATAYRGDQVINLPKFELGQFLAAIQRFKIEELFIVRSVLEEVRVSQLLMFSYLQVPPIVIAIANNKPMLDKYDLSSVQAIFTGAAPLGEEVAQKLLKQHPSWKIRQGYGTRRRLRR